MTKSFVTLTNFATKEPVIVNLDNVNYMQPNSLSGYTVLYLANGMYLSVLEHPKDIIDAGFWNEDYERKVLNALPTKV